MKAYKIVQVLEDNTLGSLMWSLLPDCVRKRYVPGQPTYPSNCTGGPLFAFESREAAVVWGDLHSHEQLWLAEVQKAERPVPKQVPMPSSWHPERLEQFWAMGKKRPCTMEVPEGTILCTSITLLERVA